MVFVLCSYKCYKGKMGDAFNPASRGMYKVFGNL